MTRKLFPLVLVGLLFAFGCSNKVQLTGKVTFSDDGSPVPLGYVQFETETFFATGPIQPNGTYRVGTDSLKDGIPKGTYTVFVRANEETMVRTGDGANSSRTLVTRSLIDSRHSHAATSGLTLTIDGKTKKFDITVDRAK